ncbi:transcription factor e(y)2-domain-containing protein [Blastocladiella britannica]|nr:transcription factor e(y)2-domain-containing protein [Blastocladiella britannica]
MDPKAIHTTLAATGQLESLKEQLRAQLAEAGWNEQVRGLIREHIRRQDLATVTVDSILDAVLAPAQESVPDPIRTDLLRAITAAVDSKRNPSS